MIPPALQGDGRGDGTEPASSPSISSAQSVPGSHYICGREMTQHWGIVADPTLVPDVEAVGAAIRESFDELHAPALETVPSASSR